MVVAEQVLKRADVPKEQTWNAESVFDNVDAWQAEFEAVTAELPQLEAFKGTLAQSAERLVEWLDVSEALTRRVMNLYFYAMMNSAVDSTNQTYKTLTGQAMGLFGKVKAMTSFADPEQLAIGEDTVMGWVDSHEPLAQYRKHYENLFRMQAYVKSGDIEQVLSMVGDPFRTSNNAASELTQSDLTYTPATNAEGQDVDVNNGTLPSALNGVDRVLRKTMWQNYMDGHLQFKNTLSNIYLGSVKQNNTMAKIRGYDDALHAQLAPNKLPNDVFHNLINTYKKNLPTWHKYWAVRERALGVDKLQPYDIWAPITPDDPKLSWEESVHFISDGMQPLGDEYVNVMRKGCLEDRWVDYSVNEGKRQGAFSYGTYDTMPFIMMTYNNSLGAMSTLAHELGHSMHSYYSRVTQPPVYAGYSMFVAEVASNFNQALVRAHLFEAKKDDPSFQIALIEEAMANFHRYFFIMPTLARFEYEVHTRVSDGKPVTADILNGIMTELFAEGYGDFMQDEAERTGITWATFQHLYVPYYTFQYATGISAAHALADGILAGDEEARDNYLTFLKSGSAVYPLDALKIAGVDMSTPEAVEKTFEVLAQMVDKLDELTQ